MSFCVKTTAQRIVALKRRLFTSATSRQSSEQPQRELWRLDERNPFLEVPEAWVTNLSQLEDQRHSLVQLHPDVFRVAPRLDLLQDNVIWQDKYRQLQLTKMLTRAEMPGGGAKPWPQKRMGRHHAGSIRSPHFIRGGFAHGARGPLTWFSILSDANRVAGLCVALTIKHAQDDLVVVDDFATLPTSDPQYLQDLADERNWGYSALFIDISTTDFAENLLSATDRIPSFTAMPLYGLNCYSIVKHETLVLSRRAVDVLERRLLEFKHMTGPQNRKYRYMDHQRTILAESESEENPVHVPMV